MKKLQWRTDSIANLESEAEEIWESCISKDRDPMLGWATFTEVVIAKLAQQRGHTSRSNGKPYKK